MHERIMISITIVHTLIILYKSLKIEVIINIYIAPNSFFNIYINHSDHIFKGKLIIE